MTMPRAWHRDPHPTAAAPSVETNPTNRHSLDGGRDDGFSTFATYTTRTRAELAVRRPRAKSDNIALWDAFQSAGSQQDLGSKGEFMDGTGNENGVEPIGGEAVELTHHAIEDDVDGHEPADPTQANGLTSAFDKAKASRWRLSSKALATEKKEKEKEKVLKLSAAQMYDLTSSPQALHLHLSKQDQESPISAPLRLPTTGLDRGSYTELVDHRDLRSETGESIGKDANTTWTTGSSSNGGPSQESPLWSPIERSRSPERPSMLSRTYSTPVLQRKPPSVKPNSILQSSTSHLKSKKHAVPPDWNSSTPISKPERLGEVPHPPMPHAIPMPPLSLPTYLQLELSSDRPSPLYMYRSASSEFPYESSRVKIDRLMNFLLLPPQLEQVLWFGTFACFDAWLYTFTILPLRFSKALCILFLSWGQNFAAEAKFLSGFIYTGLGRLWRRRALSAGTQSHIISTLTDNTDQTENTLLHPSRINSPRIKLSVATEDQSVSHSHPEPSPRRHHGINLAHRRKKSIPSGLLPDHKADILKGLLILISCTLLMYLDASMMYHSIRGQAAIKLYVIYNVLEVFDRLLSALGQDVLECLFSQESLERKPNGHSKILRPFWLFMLALLYNILHSTALFYQVITLNVAVNSYSNALLTLLMSNQFVEIKSTVFKRIEKENLFQLTCADVVERFQLWLMLIIIASRNIVETNGLGSSSIGSSTTSSIAPKTFTLFPDWIAPIIAPFLLVLGTEMLVDWLKHAYITKFNNTKPNIYGRFLDVLAKDYYSNAFSDPNLTRRLGLPVLPLATLFIRASVQTYQMFLATHTPSPLPPSPSTSLALDESLAASSPSTTAALRHIDHIIRHALGHAPSPNPPPWLSWTFLTSSQLTTTLSTVLFFGLLYLLLLACKLLLGMGLLAYARGRYESMGEREGEGSAAEGKRVGSWGVVEVGEERRRWVYQDDEEGFRRLRERDERARREGEKGRQEKGFEKVRRYSMVGKRIW